jgi:2-desacetyl-2-hydroxyethyl bacteriochlorophyllide A dehydrogenase
MQAVVFGPDRKPHVQEVSEPVPAADEVLLRVGYCGICGSDLHASTPDFRVGVTMGHEFAGEIVEVGADVEGWRTGDRACVNPNGDWCGACDFCRQGLYNMCPSIWDTVVGLVRNGGMAPLAAVKARTLHRLPDAVTPKQAAWVEPLAVALRTVRRSGLTVGNPALVFGAGPIGLLVIKLLRAAGASTITAVEPNDARAKAALGAGADHVIDPTRGPVEEYFPDPLSAPAHAFECTGVANVVRTALQVLRPHGRLTITGFAREDPSFRSSDLLFKEVEIRGSFIYIDEFPAAIDLLARGAVDVEPLTTEVMDFGSGPEAFAKMLPSSSTIKILLSPRA